MILKVSVTADEELKTKVWFVPRAGSFGHVVFNGLHVVQVWALAIARAEAPTRNDENFMAMRSSCYRRLRGVVLSDFVGECEIVVDSRPDAVES